MFKDDATRAALKRRALTYCLKALAIGGTLIARSLDRIWRGLRDLIHTRGE